MRFQSIDSVSVSIGKLFGRARPMDWVGLAVDGGRSHREHWTAQPFVGHARIPGSR